MSKDLRRPTRSQLESLQETIDAARRSLEELESVKDRLKRCEDVGGLLLSAAGDLRLASRDVAELAEAIIDPPAETERQAMDIWRQQHHRSLFYAILAGAPEIPDLAIQDPLRPASTTVRELTAAAARGAPMAFLGKGEFSAPRYIYTIIRTMTGQPGSGYLCPHKTGFYRTRRGTEMVNELAEEDREDALALEVPQIPRFGA